MGKKKKNFTKSKCAVCEATGEQLEYKGYVRVDRKNLGIEKRVREVYNGNVLCYQCLDLLEANQLDY